MPSAGIKYNMLQESLHKHHAEGAQPTHVLMV